jgi:hypothetical protein
VTGRPVDLAAFEAGRKVGAALGVLVCAVLNGLLIAAAVLACIQAWPG